MSDFEAFRGRVVDRLSRPLPGSPAQRLMAPSHRSERVQPGPTVREGAVLILLFPTSDGVSTLFTIRPKGLADHAGQISFPGGKREEGETFEETALRECEEEVGIPRSSVDLLGSLSTLFIPPTRFIVHPFIGTVSSRPMLTPDEREVDAVLEVPLEALRDPSSRAKEEWAVSGQRSIVPFFRIDGHIIWGATAMITAELIELLADERSN